MKSVQVYDPPMCCSTGVCGPDVDPELVAVAGFLKNLGGRGVKVERFNLAQQPIAFVQNGRVKDLLQNEGTGVLPLVFVDGELASKGAYPDERTRADWLLRASDPGNGEA